MKKGLETEKLTEALKFEINRILSLEQGMTILEIASLSQAISLKRLADIKEVELSRSSGGPINNEFYEHQ